MTIQEASEKLASELNGWFKPGAVTVGHNEVDTIYLYVQELIPGAYVKLGASYEGFKLIKRRIGSIRPAGEES